MEDALIDDIVKLYDEEKWRELIVKYHDHKSRATILWVFPSEENLHFLKTCLEYANCNSVISIGSGSGLLEWIIEKSTGFPVSCLETDESWWMSKYSPKTFKPLHYAKKDLSNDAETLHLLNIAIHSAILFCYFNNGDAFRSYMQYFRGKMLIIIGPIRGSGIHTDPTPFLRQTLPGWNELTNQRVRNSNDYIVVYEKC